MYQVAYNIASEKTRRREINALIQGAHDLKCKELYLITDFERQTVEKEGCTVHVVPAYEWLLNS